MYICLLLIFQTNKSRLNILKSKHTSDRQFQRKSLKSRFFVCFILLTSYCILFSTTSTAQNRCVWLKTTEKSFELDTLSIIPSSIIIQKSDSSKLTIEYDLNTRQAKFLGNLTGLDSVLVCYSVLPFDLSKMDFKRNPKLFDTTDRYAEEFFKNQNPYDEKKEEILDLKGINKSGNLTRGISFGNTQNVFVNSALNLQLDGKLSDEISITAAISDQNIPYQPEGNTAQIQDFDRVFIKLSHKYGSLTAGDIVLQQRENYFLKFYKNVQGGFLETHYDFNAKSKASTQLGFAVAKGKFASITLPQIEGVQGPYRLIGANNEQFIIVLANSEKVFIDGKQLQRGFNNDYVIDYNNAEITFNNQILITQFTRIRVDFEYSEQNYSRAILTASHYQKYNKTDFFFNFYREADNFRNPLTTLTDEEKFALSQSGDLQGIISGEDSIGFNSNSVLYRKIDSTTTNGTYTAIYVYSTSSENAFYRVTFTEVGQGKGDYVRINTTLNGQVYAWVEPQNGIKQGNYAPVQLLPTPTSKQLITLGIAQNLSEKDKFFAEIAFSNEDLNRFATLENADNLGTAFKIGYKNQGKKIKFLPKYEWFGNVDYEWDSQNFKFIDRFRSIEFDRDWSINTDTSRIADNLYNFQLGIRKDADNYLNYRFAGRQRGEQANGLQQAFEGSQVLGKFVLKLSAFQLRNRLDSLLSTWERLSSDLGFRLKKATIGYRYNLDKNKIIQSNTDSIVSTAMNFDEQVLYFKTSDSSKVKLNLDYSYRTDNAPIEGEFSKSLEAHTGNINLQTTIKEKHQIQLTFTYRNFRDFVDSTAQQKNQDNIQGRLDWNANVADKHIRSELTFATATGRELQREFVFLSVQTGQGTHTWRDDNGDAVQDLNEFYLAINPDERTFIKVFTPTTDYIKAFTNNFSYRLNWQAPRKWSNLKGLKGFVGKISGVNAWTINRRFTADNLTARLIPFSELAPNELLSTQESLRSTLFFNRNNLIFGSDLNYSLTRQKQLLTNGFEARDKQEWRWNIRRNLGKYFNVRFSSSQILQTNTSDFLLTRNYQILTYQFNPEIAYQANQDFRINLSYNFALKNNPQGIELKEKATVHQLAVELRSNKAGKRNIIAQVRYVNIAYNAEANTPISYDMLEALQVGTNFTWNLNLQQRLSNGLQLTITYDGRKSANTPTINIGRMQLTALF